MVARSSRWGKWGGGLTIEWRQTQSAASSMSATAIMRIHSFKAQEFYVVQSEFYGQDSEEASDGSPWPCRAAPVSSAAGCAEAAARWAAAWHQQLSPGHPPCMRNLQVDGMLEFE